MNLSGNSMYGIIYLLAINIITFIIYGIDKWSAIHGRTRIRVSTLLGLAFIGGSIGALCAMYLFRHKTLKPAFTIGIPMMLIVQVAVLIALTYYDILWFRYLLGVISIFYLTFILSDRQSAPETWKI